MSEAQWARKGAVEAQLQGHGAGLGMCMCAATDRLVEEVHHALALLLGGNALATLDGAQKGIIDGCCQWRCAMCVRYTVSRAYRRGLRG